MKVSRLILAALMSTSLAAQAGIFYQGTVSGGGTQAGSLVNSTIADGNVGGMWNTMNLTGAGLGSSLTDIKVTLNVSSSGYNGDLYAYLSYKGVLVPLLNRIGVSSGNSFGSPGQGLNNVTLSDAGLVNIHTYVVGSSALSGTYRPDGQTTSPLGSASSFAADGGSLTFRAVGTGFGNLDPNGQWTLFFADVVAGGGNSTLNGWNLEITAVPEPVDVALGWFAGVFVVVTLVRSGRVRKILRAV